jgi:hypothetical protein
MKITDKQYRILKVIFGVPSDRGITANELASMVWRGIPEYEYLFTAITNGGNGACSGKKAWLCMGSQVGKLMKNGLVRYANNRCKGYILTFRGVEAITEYELNHK